MFPELLRLKRWRRASGLTLIELLIAVAAVAVLSAVALPAYQNSVRKAHRTDAKTALTEAAQRMERHFTENSTYTTATVGNQPTDTVKSKSENGYYTLALNPAPGANPPTFTLRATPQGAQAADYCGAFTINEKGEPGVVGGTLTLEKCW